MASGPVIFPHGGREIVAVAARDGRLLLLDAASLGGATHATPLHISRSFMAGNTAVTPGALATWQKMVPQPAAGAPAPPAAVGGAPGTPSVPAMQSGTRWLLVPLAGPPPTDAGFATNGPLSDGTILALKVVGEADAIALEPGWASRNLKAPVAPIVVNDVVFAASTGRPDGQATLYALDGTTGREIWNSGNTLASFMPGRTLWSSNSQVYVGAYDGTVYAFGFALERR
jgi:outer membrane protein assembly factor BamB